MSKEGAKSGMTEFFNLPSRPHLRLAYNLLEGDGPGIVFLTGLKSDMTGTKALALEDYCRKNGRTFLRFDYLGHGQSSLMYEDTTLHDWFESVEVIVRGLQLDRQTIVGSSLGGWLGLIFAHRFPHLVHGFVGIASAVEFTDELLKDLNKKNQEELARKGCIQIESDYGDPYVFTQELLSSGQDFRVFDDAFRLKCPVRLLHGLDDIDVQPSVSRRLMRHIDCDDMAMNLVSGADHRFSDTRCLEWIVAAVESIMLTTRLAGH